MCVRKFLRVLFCGLLRFFRTSTTSFWRVLNKLRLRYTHRINMSDDECEYDSTWEDEQENITPRKKEFYSRNTYAAKDMQNFRHSSREYYRRNTYAAKDMQNFRHSCRGLDDHDDDDDDDDADGNNDDGIQGHFYNLKFYRGQIKSSPDDVHIKDFHEKWVGKYKKLENVHTYIQWLFPIQEPGVNWRAYELTKKEIKLFRKDKKVKSKLVKSYELMLDFYGICLVDDSTGEVKRASNWVERFTNLNRYTHNNLRITRILKCLGTLGLEHYQAPLVKFFLHETLVNGQLENVKQSALDYFIFAVLDKSKRRELVKYAFQHFKPREHFVWGPKKILLGQAACCKKENVDQPTGNKKSSTAEDQPKRVNKDEPVISNKLTETINDQGANKSSHWSSHSESVEMQKQKNDDGVSDDNDKDKTGNMSLCLDVSGSNQTKKESACQMPGIEMREKPKDKREELKDQQKSVNPRDSKHEVNKIDASYPPDETEIKEDHQNKKEPFIQNNLTETNSDHGANESSQCSSENESVVMQNQKIDGGTGDVIDDVSSSNQTKAESACQMPDIEMGEKTEDKHKELKDQKKSVNPCENKHEMNKKDASYSPDETEMKEDHQNKKEPFIPNKLTEKNCYQGANENSQSSSVNESDGDDYKTTTNMSHGDETKESSFEMREESEEEQKSVNKLDASTEPSETDHQKKSKSVSPNKLMVKNIKSDQGADENSQCSIGKKSVEKQDQEMSIGDSDGDDNDASGAKEESSCEMRDNDSLNKINQGASCLMSDIEMSEINE